MRPTGPPNAERSFGVSIGALLCVVALVLAWRGRLAAGGIVGGTGVLLVWFGLVWPSLLKWPSAVWWRVVYVLGYVNARIILTVLFAIILIPLGAIWRALGRDPLGRRRVAWSGWTPYPARYRDARHYSRMY